MERRRSASSARGRRAARSVRHIPDSAIDFSDIPESTDTELKKARRVGRPSSRDAKQLISIRIRPSLLATIRRTARQRGEPYQTLIHKILEKAAKNFA